MNLMILTRDKISNDAMWNFLHTAERKYLVNDQATMVAWNNGGSTTGTGGGCALGDQ